MSSVEEVYEPVIGLEIHVQLGVKSKIFSGDKNAYGSEPNTLIGPITLGYPGVLPVLNERALEFAVKLGLALNCKIASEVVFDRKHYFYPDLPKGFQTTQERIPICSEGHIPILTDGKVKDVKLRKIHLEEDAGKSIHDDSSEFTKLDYNRAGAPLVEIVTQPDIDSPEQAAVVMNEIRNLVRYLGISDGNMEEGSLRCDANISIRKKGDTTLGDKVELKNINSMRFVRKALSYEFKRQCKLLSEYKKIVQETRTYNTSSNTTHSMRSKETVDDYRYFPEPDLPPQPVSKEYVAGIQEQLPKLPFKLKSKYLDEGIGEKEAESIIQDIELNKYFQQLVDLTRDFKISANWLLGPVKSYLNNTGTDASTFPISASDLSALITYVKEGKISHHIATREVFKKWLEEPDKSFQNFISQNEDVNSSGLEDVIKEIKTDFPNELKQYQSGKKKLFGFFMGEFMKRTKGKVDPKKGKELISEALKN